ncbi:unnamed protein product [Callosobruchus maculatus]|uniref:OBG-type G domain-containing protein n=1 Tax=Callosobruchus maculatus TaxID=64391 RepID=A0A653C2J9_CALMS|nr:unnamed protein product [Callosobruchus maculatus]
MSKKKKPKATDESLTSSLGFTQMCSLENNSKSIAELLKENEELKEIIQQNQQIQQEMDIIILTECWKIENPSLFGIKDYNIVYNYGTVNQNDGVLLMPPKKVQEPEKKPLIGRVGTNLKVGIVGVPNVGKSTFFNVLTKSSAAAENFPFCTIDPNENKYFFYTIFDKLPARLLSKNIHMIF